MSLRALHRRIAIVTAVVCWSCPAWAQTAAAPAAPRLTPAEMQEFLESAKIVKRQDAGDGVTGSLRVTLENERLTHDAHVQTVDEAENVYHARGYVELNFKDTYRYNVAAYKVAQLIGLETVPMSVKRYIDGKEAAVTWWLDDVLMDERRRLKSNTRPPNPTRVASQLQVMRIFDELIQNRDRNQGNIVWSRDWTLWLIDHTRAFRLQEKLMKPKSLARCDRRLLAGMRALTAEALESATDGVLNGDERKALIARRDLLVKLFDQRIAKYGESTVVFAF